MNTFFNFKKYKFNNIVLDKYQTKAVLCKSDNYLVVAGAGSGKTLTIVAKVNYLIENNINPQNILCISYTNETVNSLKKSLEKNNLKIDVKTFHKLSLDILNKSYNISNNNLLEYIIEEFFESIIYQDKTYLLLDFININYVKKIILSFISRLKALNYDENYLLFLLKNKNIKTDDKILIVFAFKIFIIYQNELKSENKIDFDDMISLATKKVEKLKLFRYSYIIIDEYQDTSRSKYLLIKAIIDKFNVKIMAVGDDYQSIYSFNGCDLSLFLKFKKLFNKSKIIKLKNTYRNPNDIVEISKRFIAKNRNQITKSLKSNKYINNSLNIVYINNEEEALNKIISKYDNIMVIGRNNKDIDKYKDKSFNKDITFLTAHSSKGLEKENVIILNVIDDNLGFPNKINNNDIFSYLADFNQLEEERRLFYVAITRAKNKVIIFTKKNKESVFVKELIKDYKRKIKIFYLD